MPSFSASPDRPPEEGEGEDTPSPDETAPFTLYEWNAGIGTTTLSFLDSPYVERVISNESNPQKRAMLIQNIAAYKREGKSTVTGENTFSPVSWLKIPGSAVYLDLFAAGIILGFP